MAHSIRLLVAGVLAATALWPAADRVPGWAVVAFVVALLLAAVPATIKRISAERSLIRRLWKSLSHR